MLLTLGYEKSSSRLLIFKTGLDGDLQVVDGNEENITIVIRRQARDCPRTCSLISFPTIRVHGRKWTEDGHGITSSILGSQITWSLKLLNQCLQKLSSSIINPAGE